MKSQKANVAGLLLVLGMDGETGFGKFHERLTPLSSSLFQDQLSCHGVPCLGAFVLNPHKSAKKQDSGRKQHTLVYAMRGEHSPFHGDKKRLFAW